MKLKPAPDPSAPRTRRMLDWGAVARKLHKHPGRWYFSPYPETGSYLTNIRSGKVPALPWDRYEARLYQGALILRERVTPLGVVDVLDPPDMEVDH